jgi:hypothetical protein
MEGSLTLGGVKPCDLDKVVTLRPLKLGHLLLSTKRSEFSHVVLGVPDVNSKMRIKKVETEITYQESRSLLRPSSLNV